MTTLNLSLTITPDAKAQAMLDAFCQARGYNPGSGKTQVQFLKDEVKEFLLQPYVAQQTASLAATSRAQIAADVGSITIA